MSQHSNLPAPRIGANYFLALTVAAWLTAPLLPVTAQPPAGDDLDGLQERAMKAAVLKVAPSVVQIQTTGGSEVIVTGAGGTGIRKGTGPTTGLIVDAGGYVISSAFNFANKPGEIDVSVPGRKDHYIAKIVATDHTRMLTLLKIEATGLAVPAAAPRKEFKVGQWALALGRTLASTDSPPSVSVGIISALNRIWGKAVQTDAKVSPVNYGGPLVDIQGRVQGVLVPASPREAGEAAGFEWYDSGIGFAIPLEDINAVLPRLKQGQDLSRGLLGVLLQGQDIYGTTAVVASVAPDSAAALAGIKPGDTITEIDGIKIVRQAQMMHMLGNKYEGDLISVTAKRGSEELHFTNVKLTGALTSVAQPFLGLLPVRDDPEVGEAVRYVYPKSPADAAGVKAGDRILSVTREKAKSVAFSGRDQLSALLSPLSPATELTLAVRHKDAKASVNVVLKLGVSPDTVPDELPEPASLHKALEPHKAVNGTAPAPAKSVAGKKPETGFVQHSNASGDRHYWLFVPADYDANVGYALVVWLHPAHRGGEREARSIVRLWQESCSKNHIILVGPQAQNDTGWLFNEADFVQETAREVMAQYTIDHQRVVVHGMGSGGNLALYLAFQARDLFRGVASVGGVLPGTPREAVAAQPVSFFIVSGSKDPLVDAIGQTRSALAANKFPVVFRLLADKAHEYLDTDEKVFRELVRWIDSLDRQ